MKIQFTSLEEDWRFATASLRQPHRISDTEILNILEAGVFSNDQLDAPRKIDAYFRELPVVFCDPIDPKDLEVNIRKAPKGSNDISELILNTITHKEFRRGSAKLFEPFKAILLHRIRAFVNANRPIHIVLPTLPSKGQNSARNDHSIDDVLLGEMFFFAQLRDIAASIKNIYEPGAKITVITDGIIYADMFRNNNTPSAINYRNKCMVLRDEMKLRDVIDIVDMDWIIQGEANFPILRNHIHERLLYLWDTNASAKKRMDSLARGMIFNLPTPGAKFDRAIQTANTPFGELTPAFQEKIKFTALRYAACIISLTYLQVIDRAFPGSVRATVHPKSAAQIGLHLVNSKSTVFPYHGVVMVSEKELKATKSIRRSSRIVNLYDIMRLKHPVLKVCLKGQNSSFYYLVKDNDNRGE
jgi:pyoverdine/dityrosine biosynthesis protein Dit1